MNIKDMSYDTLRRWVTDQPDGAANKLMSLDAQLTIERQRLAECVETLMYVISEVTPDSDCPHNENNTDYCCICLRAKIERLTVERDTAEANLERLQNKFAAVSGEIADEIERLTAELIDNETRP